MGPPYVLTPHHLPLGGESTFSVPGNEDSLETFHPTGSDLYLNPDNIAQAQLPDLLSLIIDIMINNLGNIASEGHQYVLNPHSLPLGGEAVLGSGYLHDTLYASDFTLIQTMWRQPSPASRSLTSTPTEALWNSRIRLARMAPLPRALLRCVNFHLSRRRLRTGSMIPQRIGPFAGGFLARHRTGSMFPPRISPFTGGFLARRRTGGGRNQPITAVPSNSVMQTTQRSITSNVCTQSPDVFPR